MGLMDAPRGMRLHIGIFGRRNVGKSSLLNAITRQDVSIVSDFAGTTTDPVEKPMELLPLGPVLFIDTAGIDDVGALGEQRVERTRKIFERTDVAVIVTAPEEAGLTGAAAGLWGPFEEALRAEFTGRGVPVVAVFNKADIAEPSAETLNALHVSKTVVVRTIANRDQRTSTREGIPADGVREGILAPAISGRDAAPRVE
jgi:small GTP-binding protein